MRVLNTRFKKIEAALRERYAMVIQKMESKKFLQVLKNSPSWVPEVYAFYFRMMEIANRSLKEARPKMSARGIERPMHPHAYAFILERVEELLRENPGGRVEREEVQELFLNVIKTSPSLGEESRNILVKAGSVTGIKDEDLKGICGEEN
jgi:hypothetical protein